MVLQKWSICGTNVRKMCSLSGRVASAWPEVGPLRPTDLEAFLAGPLPREEGTAQNLLGTLSFRNIPRSSEQGLPPKRFKDVA